MSIRRLAVCMLVGVLLSAQEPPVPAGNGLPSYSLEKEAALGRQLAAEIRQRNSLIDSPTVQNYLDRLGQRIAAQLQVAAFTYTFTTIAEDPCPAIHEPAVLPGGYVFVPATLFVTAQDEDELAGMLAHAMEHIAQRHGTRQASQSRVVNNASVPLIFMGGWSGSCSERAAIPRSFLALQRSHELEADALAIQTMPRAGFDPTALVRYIERVQLQPATDTQKIFSALPDRDRRVASMRSILEKLPSTNYTAPTEDFATIRQELRGLLEGRTRSRAIPTLRRSGSK